jgi:hypothetical protein
VLKPAESALLPSFPAQHVHELQLIAFNPYLIGATRIIYKFSKIHELSVYPLLNEGYTKMLYCKDRYATDFVSVFSHFQSQNFATKNKLKICPVFPANHV